MAFKQRLRNALSSLEHKDLEQQASYSIRALLDGMTGANDVREAFKELVMGLPKCGRTAARARLLLSTHALQQHGMHLSSQVPVAVAQMVAYMHDQHHSTNLEELCKLASALVACLMPSVVDSVLSHMTTFLPSSNNSLSADKLMQLVLHPVLKCATKAPEKASMTSACAVLNELLHGLASYVHIKEVVEAVRLCFDSALAQATSAPLEQRVAGVFLPLQRCVELLSISIDPAAARKLVAFAVKGSQHRDDWQMRKEAMQTLAALAAAVQIPDPLYPGRGKLVLTAAVQKMIEMKAELVQLVGRVKYDKVVLVRKAAQEAADALSTLPDLTPQFGLGICAELATGPSRDASPAKADQLRHRLQSAPTLLAAPTTQEAQRKQAHSAHSARQTDEQPSVGGGGNSTAHHTVGYARATQPLQHRKPDDSDTKGKGALSSDAWAQHSTQDNKHQDYQQHQTYSQPSDQQQHHQHHQQHQQMLARKSTAAPPPPPHPPRPAWGSRQAAASSKAAHITSSSAPAQQGSAIPHAPQPQSCSSPRMRHRTCCRPAGNLARYLDTPKRKYLVTDRTRISLGLPLRSKIVGRGMFRRPRTGGAVDFGIQIFAKPRPPPKPRRWQDVAVGAETPATTHASVMTEEPPPPPLSIATQTPRSSQHGHNPDGQPHTQVNVSLQLSPRSDPPSQVNSPAAAASQTAAATPAATASYATAGAATSTYLGSNAYSVPPAPQIVTVPAQAPPEIHIHIHQPSPTASPQGPATSVSSYPSTQPMAAAQAALPAQLSSPTRSVGHSNQVEAAQAYHTSHTYTAGADGTHISPGMQMHLAGGVVTHHPLNPPAAGAKVIDFRPWVRSAALQPTIEDVMLASAHSTPCSSGARPMSPDPTTHRSSPDAMRASGEWAPGPYVDRTPSILTVHPAEVSPSSPLAMHQHQHPDLYRRPQSPSMPSVESGRTARPYHQHSQSAPSRSEEAHSSACQPQPCFSSRPGSSGDLVAMASVPSHLGATSAQSHPHHPHHSPTSSSPTSPRHAYSYDPHPQASSSTSGRAYHSRPEEDYDDGPYGPHHPAYQTAQDGFDQGSPDVYVLPVAPPQDGGSRDTYNTAEDPRAQLAFNHTHAYEGSDAQPGASGSRPSSARPSVHHSAAQPRPPTPEQYLGVLDAAAGVVQELQGLFHGPATARVPSPLQPESVQALRASTGVLVRSQAEALHELEEMMERLARMRKQVISSTSPHSSPRHTQANIASAPQQQQQQQQPPAGLQHSLGLLSQPACTDTPAAAPTSYTPASPSQFTPHNPRPASSGTTAARPSSPYRSRPHQATGSTYVSAPAGAVLPLQYTSISAVRPDSTISARPGSPSSWGAVLDQYTTHNSSAALSGSTGSRSASPLRSRPATATAGNGMSTGPSGFTTTGSATMAPAFAGAPTSPERVARFSASPNRVAGPYLSPVVQAFARQALGASPGSSRTPSPYRGTPTSISSTSTDNGAWAARIRATLGVTSKSPYSSRSASPTSPAFHQTYTITTPGGSRLTRPASPHGSSGSPSRSSPPSMVSNLLQPAGYGYTPRPGGPYSWEPAARVAAVQDLAAAAAAAVPQVLKVGAALAQVATTSRQLNLLGSSTSSLGPLALAAAPAPSGSSLLAAAMEGLSQAAGGGLYSAITGAGLRSSSPEISPRGAYSLGLQSPGGGGMYTRRVEPLDVGILLPRTRLRKARTGV